MAAGAIFDIDGTLVTFAFDVRGTRGALIEELGRRGYDTSSLDLATPTQRILDAARAQTRPGTESGYEELRKACFSILDDFESRSVSSSAPLPGARQALELLRSKGVRMAVLTNSGRKAASEVLGRSGLSGLFEFVLTRDDTIVMKPSGGGVAMAVEKLGLPKDSVCYVGDSLFDVVAGKEAGVRVVSVATGNYTKERLGSGGADLVISTLSELPRVLGL